LKLQLTPNLREFCVVVQRRENCSKSDDNLYSLYIVMLLLLQIQSDQKTLLKLWFRVLDVVANLHSKSDGCTGPKI